MLREGVELCEAALCVQRAMDGRKLDGDQEKRAQALLNARRDRILAEVARKPDWLPSDRQERDVELLNLAGEAEKSLGGK